MAVISKEDLLKRISERIGDDNSDEALSLLEDVSDTITDFEERDSEDWKTKSEDWKTKYEENDAKWRKKYRERFENEAPDIEEKKETIEVKSYDDLFSEVK